jgi:8-hydroxy-5-deazaflavin:NADPH oxidoreductase
MEVRFGILGTGAVGKTIAARLAGLGHEVMVGTRDPEETMSRIEPDPYDNPPFSAWQEEHSEVRLGMFAEAAAHGEMIVNATAGAVSLEALEQAGEDNLNGKVLIDIARHRQSPRLRKGHATFALGIEYRLAGRADTAEVSRGEGRQNLTHHDRTPHVDPAQLAAADYTVFVSGGDSDAKVKVSELLRSLGWTDIIDLGDISTARGTEMLLPIWLRLFGALQKPIFNFKIVR